MTSLPPKSPTGRLTTSEPDMQHVPGTPLALAQTRRLKAGLARGPVSPSDISVTEKEAAWARDYFQRS